jgi:molybdopterin adenylyltransferase
MKDTTTMHKTNAPKSVRFAVVTVSTTRQVLDDKTGDEIEKSLEANGHKVVERAVVPDIAKKIEARLMELARHEDVDCVIFNGGTGIALFDVTIEAVRPKFQKELTGFNPLFVQLSYHEIGTAALLSRATAGIVERKAVFCLPGSPRASKLAVEKLIIPEISHIMKHLRDLS